MLLLLPEFREVLGDGDTLAVGVCQAEVEADPLELSLFDGILKLFDLGAVLGVFFLDN